MVELTIEQSFEYLKWKSATEQMSRVQMLDELKKAERLNFVKSNIVKSFMMGNHLSHESFILSLEQELSLALKIKEYEGMNKKIVAETLLSVMKMLIDKDNTIRSLMKSTIFT